ncbi:MAG: tyrosine-type recombinase/integrase [Thermoplasmata archaeon]
MPEKARWWNERTTGYVRKNEIVWSEEHTEGIRMALARFVTGRDPHGRRTPGIWERVGVRPAPAKACDVTAEMVARVKRSTIWAPKTRSFYLQALRGFLRWEGAPLAEDRKLWAMNAKAGPRDWLTREQLAQVWGACRDDLDRLVVASGGMNGLRRAEVRRLRARDVLLALDHAEARIEGKTGTRTIQLGSYLRNVLLSMDKRGSELYFPLKDSAYDDRLTAVGRLAGLPFHLSAHILRRSFGRIAYRARVPLVTIQHIYGHASPAMTAYYIGIESEEMAAGLLTFEAALAPGAV